MTFVERISETPLYSIFCWISALVEISEPLLEATDSSLGSFFNPRQSSRLFFFSILIQVTFKPRLFFSPPFFSIVCVESFDRRRWRRRDCQEHSDATVALKPLGLDFFGVRSSQNDPNQC